MSILIKGMEIPQTCFKCNLSRITPSMQAFCCLNEKCYPADETPPSECPLVLVPPHGRLIDADVLERELREDANDLWEQYPHTGTRTTWFEAYEHFADITAAEPTIIEAEGKKNR